MSGYSPSEERPLAAFGGLMTLYGAFAGGLGLAAFRKGLPSRVPTRDLVLLGVATLGAITVVLVAMPMVGRITGAEANRFE